ncbi:tail fiber domain-containing protein, partial [Candidatus Woesearchaeota archaeon]|nr:tail fiber domain-containing protein [Candidatus Woesearchaeota archaeon]
WTRAGRHGSILIGAGAEYGNDAGMGLQVLGSSYYNTPEIDKIRIVMGGVYDQMHLEFYYNDNGGDNTVYVEKYSAQGWDLITPTAGSVPSGNVSYNLTTDLLFGARGDTTAFVVDRDAKVGIGTTSPDNPLHVNSGTSDTALKLESTDENVDMILVDDGGTARITGNDGNLSLQRTGGNVGIGTTSPDAALHIEKEDAEQFVIEANGVKVFNVSVEGGAPAGHIYIGDYDAGAGPYYVQDHDNQYHYFMNGDLGIETDDPISDLHIVGGNPVVTLHYGSYGIGTESQLVFANGPESRTPGVGIGVGIAARDEGSHGMDLHFRVRNNSGTDWTIPDTGDTKMIIDMDGRVGIGTNSPGNELEVEDTGSTTVLRIQDSSNTCDFGVDGSGWASISCSSDEELKEEIRDLTAEEKKDIIDRVTFFGDAVKKYSWLTNGEEGIGPIAQEIKQKYPEMITTMENYDEEKNKTITEEAIIYPSNGEMLIVISEQQHKIETLQSELQALTQGKGMLTSMVAMNETVNISANQTINETIPVNIQVINETNETVPINITTNVTINQTSNQTLNATLNQTINETVNESLPETPPQQSAQAYIEGGDFIIQLG